MQEPLVILFITMLYVQKNIFKFHLFILGNDLMKINEVHKAVDCYSKAIQLDPSNAVYYSNRYSFTVDFNQNVKLCYEIWALSFHVSIWKKF